MNKRRCLVAMAALLAASPAWAANETYDRFKDRTEVSAMKPGTGMDPFKLLFGAAYKGAAPPAGDPDFIYIAYMAASFNGWKYLKCHDVAYLADGRPVPVIRDRHDGSVNRGFVMETIYGNLTLKALQQLAAAQRVEVQICHTQYAFDSADMANLADFAKALTPPPK